MITQRASCHRFLLDLAPEAAPWPEPEATAGIAAAEL